MDQGVLISIKRHYRYKLLDVLVLNDTDIVAFLKGINMLKIIRNISSSWNEITEITLRRSWGKIFPIESHSENTELGTSSEIQHTVDNDGFVTLFNIGGQDINETEISEWLEADIADKGYAHLTDQEIVEKVTNHDDSESEVEVDHNRH
ncbi:Jerky protein homolog-like [Oopsacas minuta]|uniref:Jerky protein homolog-like n=1 Tax=Oopsacas minuta TaxID=111878 RepID=A0AAV7KJ40_9METZ|nr:Jerky protein homolog-like [Oopsacas minuta]